MELWLHVGIGQIPTGDKDPFAYAVRPWRDAYAEETELEIHWKK